MYEERAAMIVGPVPPPPVGNDTEAIMAYVNHQLDSIGKRTEILGGLRLLGGGRHERLQGGKTQILAFCGLLWLLCSLYHAESPVSYTLHYTCITGVFIALCTI